MSYVWAVQADGKRAHRVVGNAGGKAIQVGRRIAGGNNVGELIVFRTDLSMVRSKDDSRRTY